MRTAEVDGAQRPGALVLRVAVDEVIGEVADEEQRRGGERRDHQVLVHDHRAALDRDPARDEERGGRLRSRRRSAAA